MLAKWIGLPWLGFAGPGGARLVGSPGDRVEVAWVRAQWPDAELDGPMRAFTARQYTLVVGGLNPHVAGVEVDESRFPLLFQRMLLNSNNNFASLAPPALSLLTSFVRPE